MRTEDPTHKTAPPGPPRRARRKAGLLVALVLLAGLVVELVPVTSAPASTTYTVHEFAAGVTAPSAITAGPDGNLWFTAHERLGKISPAGGSGVVAAELTGRTPNVITSFGGDLWFGEGGSGRENLWRATTDGGLKAYTVSEIRSITAGPAGDIWFAENAGNIDNFSPAAPPETPGSPEAHPVAPNEPEGTAVGPEGDIWFSTDSQGIWKIEPAAPFHQTPMVPAEVTHAGLYGDIAAGPSGSDTVWLLGDDEQKILRINASTGEPQEFKLPPGEELDHGTAPGVAEIVAGSDNAMWFTEPKGNKIGRITTAGGITELEELPAGSEPTGIASGPEGNIWFTEQGTNKIGEIVLPKPPVTSTTTTSTPAASTTSATSTTSTTSSSTPSAGAIPSVAGAPVVRGDTVTVKLACHGPTGQKCSGELTATSKEHFNAKHKLTAVSAKRHRKGHKKRKRPRTKEVIVGSNHFTVAAGKTEEVTLTLNRAGKKLLKRFKKLPASLRVIRDTAAGVAVLVVGKVTFKPAKRTRGHKRKRHEARHGKRSPR